MRSKNFHVKWKISPFRRKSRKAGFAELVMGADHCMKRGRGLTEIRERRWCSTTMPSTRRACSLGSWYLARGCSLASNCRSDGACFRSSACGIHSFVLPTVHLERASRVKCELLPTLLSVRPSFASMSTTSGPLPAGAPWGGFPVIVLRAIQARDRQNHSFHPCLCEPRPIEEAWCHARLMVRQWHPSQ